MLIGIRLAVAAQDQLSAIGGRQMHIHHLNVGNRARGQSRGVGLRSCLEPDRHAVSEEGDEDVRLDAIALLMPDGSDRQIRLQLLERLFDLGEFS